MENNSRGENDALGIPSIQIWQKFRRMFLKTPKNFIQAKSVNEKKSQMGRFENFIRMKSVLAYFAQELQRSLQKYMEDIILF